MAEQWYSIVEYARTFKVSDMTVRRRIKTGKLRAVLKEGKYFIPVQMSGGKPVVPVEADYADAPVMAPQAQPKRAPHPNEMQVIKGHPNAHKTYVPPVAPQPTMANPMPHMPPVHSMPQMPQMAAPSFEFGDEGGHESVVPQSLRRPLQQQDTSLVDTRALLAFCEATLRKLNEGERRTVEKFKSKLEALEATLQSKDQEIKQLRQQVEDLQLLVKILEKKRG